MSARATAVAALSVAVVSLALNVVLLWRLREAESVIAPYRELLAEMIREDGVLAPEVRIPAGTPIALDVPVDERVIVRVDTVIPINTRVNVPIRSPVGNYSVPVPIRANVPLRAAVPLRVQHTFRLRTSTSSEIVVPLELGP